MGSIIILLLKIVGGVLGIALLAVVGITLLISAVLFVVVLLQFGGVLKRVPLNYNFRNLLVRWRITVLTGLAFTLVVALMTVMLAFVNGMYTLTKGSAVPGNVIVLAEGSTDEVFSDLAFGDISRLANEPFVEKANLEIQGKIKSEPLISWELFILANQPIPNAKPGARQRRFIQVRGIEEPVISGSVHNLRLHEGGQWFSPAGVQAPAEGKGEQLIQGVLGEGIARELGHDSGKDTLKVGDEFELGPRKWVVVGVMQSGGSTFDSEIWAKREVAGDIFNKRTRTTAVIRTRDAAAADEAASSLTENFKSPSVKAQTEIAYYESLNATNKSFLYSIIFVAVVMAIGCVFGVMNTMFAAIAQRTKDIGVLRILGFSRWQILISFFLESVLLALLGGALGCALGSLSHGWTASSIMSSGQGGGKSVVLKLVVDARILGSGLGFALVMGCIGGLLPALSAVRLKLLDSLR